MSKILITGGSGFVGRAILQHPKFSSALTIGRTKPSSDHNFFKTSLDSETDYSEILEDKDVILHLAARAHVMSDKSNDPLREYRHINTDATLNLAVQAAKAGVKRFIFISTVKVLGEKTSRGKKFTAFDALNPMDPYSVSKAEAEVGVQEISRDTGMEFVIIRPTLIYGPGAKGNLERLIKLISLKIPLPLKSIKNKRSMVSIDNLVDLISRCLDSEKAENQIFMVSDDYDLSTPDLVKIICRSRGIVPSLFNFPVKLMWFLLKCLGKENVYDRVCGSMEVNIEYTKSQLDWNPPYKIEDCFGKYSKNGN